MLGWQVGDLLKSFLYLRWPSCHHFSHAGSLLGISVLATAYGGKRCPSTAFFNYSTWQKIQIFITKLLIIEYMSGILNWIYWTSQHPCLKQKGDICLKIFITASRKVLSICQTYSVTTYLDQVQMFPLPQIYFQSQTRQRVRFFFFAAVISTASFRTNWFNMWSPRVVLLLEILNCLQRMQGYLKTDTMEQYIQTRRLLPLHCKACLPQTNFFIACMDADFSQRAVSWNTSVECVKLHHK